ncbi:MAG: hypothetical protein U9O56_09445 [Campylobacterota bacterium]|nr:hypothetical protein [Campylobacterota bacterium]
MKFKLLKTTTICIAILFHIGCGEDEKRPNLILEQNDDNNNDDNDTIYQASQVYEVERGAVYGAKVVDANGLFALQDIDTNIYRFSVVPTYPIVVSSGWIDIDSDQNKSRSDIELDIELSSYYSSITPVTTILAESNDTKREAIESKLTQYFDLNSSELIQIPSKSTNQNLAVLTNAIYKSSKENNTTIKELFNYKTLIEENNQTLKQSYDELFSISDTSIYTNGKIDSLKLEKYLFDTNNSLFTKLENLGTIENKIKLSSDDIEDIWEISFKIDSDYNYTDFDIGVEFIKYEDDGSNDKGEFVYTNLSITDGNISTPTELRVYGYGDSGSGGTWFDTSYNPQQVLEKSITLDDNILSLNLGYVMKNQSAVSETTFKVKTTYDITIVASKPIFKYSSTKSLELINKKYSFLNKYGMTSEIQIK